VSSYQQKFNVFFLTHKTCTVMAMNTHEMPTGSYDYQSYLDHEDFQAFVREAARQFVEQASLEELAEMVFGDLDKAIEAFAEEAFAEEAFAEETFAEEGESDEQQAEGA